MPLRPIRCVFVAIVFETGINYFLGSLTPGTPRNETKVARSAVKLFVVLRLATYEQTR